MTPDPAPHAAGARGRRRRAAASRRAATAVRARRVARGTVPYLLVAPVVRRDRRDPRLPALQARHALVPGVRAPAADPAPRGVDRPRELPLRPLGQRVLGHACADDRVHRGERRADDRARDADRAPPPAALDARPHPADVGARARLVDAARRRRPGLVLDDELPERHPQLRPHRARGRRLLPARLVRLAVLPARDGDDPDRLGCDPVRDGDGLRRARAGPARARRGGADRRREPAAGVPRRHVPGAEADPAHPHEPVDHLGLRGLHAALSADRRLTRRRVELPDGGLRLHRGLRALRLRARRGDLDPDAADRRRDERVVRAADGAHGRT